MAGEGIYRFLLRMPEELRVRLNDAASGTGRSLNKEIVDRLEQSFAAAPEAAPVGVKREDYMRIFRGKRTALVLAATVAVLAAVLAGLVTTSRTHSASPQSSVKIKLAGKELQRSSQGGVANGGGGGESADLFAAQQQWDNTRTAPGIVAPGAYSAAFASLQGLSATSGSWNEVTRVPYDADDPDYRDYYSNSSGGSGLVTGRVTALAVGKDGVVYAGGADGGVWRSTTGRGSWQPIADSLPSLSSGDLQIDPTGALWYGTGEANTGGTSYVGSGVYRLANPATRHVLALEPHRRHRAREHDDLPPPLRGRHRLRGDAARRLLALGQRPRRDAVETALRARARRTCRAARTPARRTPATRTSSTTSRSIRRTRSI